jgi:hypothetical protein
MKKTKIHARGGFGRPLCGCQGNPPLVPDDVFIRANKGRCERCCEALKRIDHDN